MEHLRHLPVKTLPSDQGTRPCGATRCAGCPPVKKKAARRPNGRKRMLLHSHHHHVKIVRRLSRWHASSKTKHHLHNGLW